jgi:hypothetical protein
MRHAVVVRPTLSGICMLFLFALAARAKPPETSAFSKLVFHDEFDSLDLDTTEVNHMQFGGGHHAWYPNSGQAWDGPLFCDASESYIGYGNSRLGVKLHEITPEHTLKLYAYPTPTDKLLNVRCFPYLGSKLVSEPPNVFTYIGYIEFRTRFFLQQGMHPCVWAAGYKGREIDVAELFGEYRTRCGTTSRFNTINLGGGGKWGGSLDSLHGQPLHVDDWHTYGLFWNGDESDTLRFYIDDSCWSVLPASEKPGLASDTVSLIMNVEVGCNVDPDSTVKWPYVMEVDYVRVYKKP